MSRPSRLRGPSLTPSVARATATTVDVRLPRRTRDETTTQILDYDGISIAATATVPLPECLPVVDARPTVRDLEPPVAASKYQYTNKRGNAGRATKRDMPVMAAADHTTPVAATGQLATDIRVSSEGDEVRLQLGQVTVRCTPATATWIAKALLTAARG